MTNRSSRAAGRAACILMLVLAGVLAAAPALAAPDSPPAAPSEKQPAAEPKAFDIQKMSWLSGCWESRDERDHTEEQWTAPEGGTMIGMSRTIRRGRTIAWENLRIEEREGDLIFTARPSTQPEASFLLKQLDDAAAVFENPDHDFPQRVIYRLGADGKLLGRIEGIEKGKEKSVDFPMQRVACPGPAKGK